MSRRKLRVSKNEKIEVPLTPDQKEYIARMAYSQNMSMGEFLRTGRVPSDSTLKNVLQMLRFNMKADKSDFKWP